ncbi:hypothetical protein [Neobacillus massiliamazoniensis]|uniref:Uncharacterized protein n=1 Tax=Neobacillus massiliamazoniensis TaxID=1499688 RepID=A0A0U1NQJ3_9BACI|nr:hypothetical protein [Neobacillus massiliamazoniensis]CRK80299.1 hypothetical protein BN000_00180 [Neobacillus massiliamazoniensis]
MIEIIIDHSYEDDYFMISNIDVKIKDVAEKERVEKLVKQSGLEGQLVTPDRDLIERIAKILDVREELIDIDTNEIDLM